MLKKKIENMVAVLLPIMIIGTIVPAGVIVQAKPLVNRYDYSCIGQAPSVFVDAEGIRYQVDQGGEVAKLFENNFSGNIVIQDQTTTKTNAFKYPVVVPEGSFAQSTDLNSITVSEDNNLYTSEDGVLFNKDKTELIAYPSGKTEKSYIIPSTVTSIMKSAFSGCSNLTNITIPSGVRSIKYNTFYGCSNLIDITIPDSVQDISGSAFGGCTNLKSINVNKNNKNYVSEDGILFNSDKTMLIAVPSGMNKKSYCIPESVSVIGFSAFDGWSSLESIAIPSNISMIDWNAFNGCINLNSIEVDKNNGKYSSKEGVLFNKDETELILCPNNKNSYSIPSSVTSIKERAFSGCKKLKSLTIPDSVKNIEAYAFYGCSSLESIRMPKSITSLENYLFEGCSSLKDITIPSSVTSIDKSIFSGCTNLSSINVDENNSEYSSDDGVLYNKDKSEIILFPYNKNSYTIPNGVTIIRDNAFSDCKKLRNLVIPNTVTEIGMAAFQGSSSLESIDIPSSVTKIGRSAFNKCSSLESITIPSSIKSISFDNEVGCIRGYTETNIEAYDIAEKSNFLNRELFGEFVNYYTCNYGDYISEDGVNFTKKDSTTKQTVATTTVTPPEPENKKSIGVYVASGTLQSLDYIIDDYEELVKIVVEESPDDNGQKYWFSYFAKRDSDICKELEKATIGKHIELVYSLGTQRKGATPICSVKVAADPSTITATTESPKETATSTVTKETPKETATSTVTEETPKETATSTVTEETPKETATSTTVTEETPKETATSTVTEETPKDTATSTTVTVKKDEEQKPSDSSSETTKSGDVSALPLISSLIVGAIGMAKLKRKRK